ncbi:arabinose operon transcriptional regulator AraC [Paenibacillus sp. y28]|uniref:arabinose operon transcriptional regulator AraC n=1 Tax=Paenibacillus sp. y28 TaxID=3129110 RepID=UPI0030190653
MADDHNNPADHYHESASPPPGIWVAGHFIEQDDYLVRRSGGTKDWLITYTLRGEGHYMLQHAHYPCREGDVVLLSPGTPHLYRTPPGGCWEFMWAHFIPDPRWSAWLRLPSDSKGMDILHIGHASSRERLRGAFERLIQSSRDSSRYHMLLSLNAMEEILLYLQQSTDNSTQSIDPRVEDTLQYISRHLKEQHRIEHLARRVLLSPSRLSHLFKEETGESIVETLLNIRLRQAARLLEHTTMSVAEIAEEVGFHSPFYFTKQFKHRFGLNPTSYRGRYSR